MEHWGRPAVNGLALSGKARVLAAAVMMMAAFSAFPADAQQKQENRMARVSAPALVMPSPSLTAAGAKAALAAAERAAAHNNWSVSIAVMDAGGNLLAFHRMDGAMLLSIDLSLRKARTVVISKMPSKALEDKLRSGDQTVLMAHEIIAAEGGVPVIVDGVVVGGIGVSGVESRFDAQIAQAGADCVAGHGAVATC
jgi:glc operon protein GlcG